jgi:hypothetical protein
VSLVTTITFLRDSKGTQNYYAHLFRRENGNVGVYGNLTINDEPQDAPLSQSFLIPLTQKSSNIPANRSALIPRVWRSPTVQEFLHPVHSNMPTRSYSCFSLSQVVLKKIDSLE